MVELSVFWEAGVGVGGEGFDGLGLGAFPVGGDGFDLLAAFLCDEGEACLAVDFGAACALGAESGLACFSELGIFGGG